MAARRSHIRRFDGFRAWPWVGKEAARVTFGGCGSVRSTYATLLNLGHPEQNWPIALAGLRTGFRQAVPISTIVAAPWRTRTAAISSCHLHTALPQLRRGAHPLAFSLWPFGDRHRVIPSFWSMTDKGFLRPTLNKALPRQHSALSSVPKVLRSGPSHRDWRSDNALDSSSVLGPEL